MFIHTQPHLSRIFTSFIARDAGLDFLSPIMFMGYQGTGKAHYIRSFIQQMGCTASDVQAFHPFTFSSPDEFKHIQANCNCPSCERFRLDQHIDYLQFDGSESIAEFRERIQDFASHHPAILPYRFLVLSNCHRYSKEVFDTALKIIEEPPKHLKIFATVTTPKLLPPAILSRFRTFQTRYLSQEQIQQILQTNPKFGPLRKIYTNYPFRGIKDISAYFRYSFESLFSDLFISMDITTLQKNISSILASFKQDQELGYIDLLDFFLTFYMDRALAYCDRNIDATPQLGQLRIYIHQIFLKYEPSLFRYYKTHSSAYFINIEHQVSSLFHSIIAARAMCMVPQS